MNYGYNDSSASEQFFHHQQQLNNQNSGYQVPLPVYEDSSDDEQQNQTFNNNNNSATSTAASTTSTSSSSSSSNPDQPIETNTRNDPSHQLSSRKRKKTQKKRAIQKRQNLSSGYRFVYKAGKRWQVRTKYKSKQFYVGVYNDKVIAARAADFIIHREKWPPYMLNFPDEGPVAELPKVVTKGRINNNPQPARNKTGKKKEKNVQSMYSNLNVIVFCLKIQFSCFLFISLQFYLLHFQFLFYVILLLLFFFQV